MFQRNSDQKPVVSKGRLVGAAALFRTQVKVPTVTPGPFAYVSSSVISKLIEIVAAALSIPDTLQYFVSDS